MAKQFTIYIGTAGAPVPSADAKKTVAGLADNFFCEYTLQEGTGAWNGGREDTIAVTYIVDAGGDTLAEQFAQTVAGALNQECVLVVEQDVKATFVTP